MEITFFLFAPTNKPSESKGNFMQASNHCKRVLEAAYAIETNKSITSLGKLGPQNFWRIANTILNKVKSVKNSLFNGRLVLSSPSD